MSMHRDVVSWFLTSTFARRATLTAMSAALLLSIGDVVLAQPESAPAMAEDPGMLPYVEPGQLVDIGGRRINLHCTGAGGPTVILMAGLSSWSVVWYKTQPAIAKRRASAPSTEPAMASAIRRRGRRFSPTWWTTCTRRSRPGPYRDRMCWWGTLWAVWRRGYTRSAGPRRSWAWSSTIPVRPERGSSTRISRVSMR